MDLRSYFDARDSNERLGGGFPAVTRGSFRFSGSLWRNWRFAGPFSMAPSVQSIGTS
jgi:hypothetical protein